MTLFNFGWGDNKDPSEPSKGAGTDQSSSLTPNSIYSLESNLEIHGKGKRKLNLQGEQDPDKR